MNYAKRFVVEPGAKIRLDKVDPGFKENHDESHKQSQVLHCGSAAVTARTQAAKGVAQEVTTLQLGELVDVTHEIPRDGDH